jgi:hypothetical protein
MALDTFMDVPISSSSELLYAVSVPAIFANGTCEGVTCNGGGGCLSCTVSLFLPTSSRIRDWLLDVDVQQTSFSSPFNKISEILWDEKMVMQNCDPGLQCMSTFHSCVTKKSMLSVFGRVASAQTTVTVTMINIQKNDCPEMIMNDLVVNVKLSALIGSAIGAAGKVFTETAGKLVLIPSDQKLSLNVTKPIMLDLLTTGALSGLNMTSSTSVIQNASIYSLERSLDCSFWSPVLLKSHSIVGSPGHFSSPSVCESCSNEFISLIFSSPIVAKVSGFIFVIYLMIISFSV